VKFVAPFTLGLLAAGTFLAGQQQPAFHTRTDVIAVDVQVVDRNGRPARGLGADKFEVTIDGKRRRVVSVDFIDYRAAASTSVAGDGRPQARRLRQRRPRRRRRSRQANLSSCPAAS
jgi:hypothetical protein